ncbi:hypothetical protein [Streptomyces sp. NPDC088270]|uniref:hypothetical protein n=1 Tax=Streptomyces sp. NPDC088270 TaxID=3160990 RepID=UPI00342A6F58
MTTAAAYVAAPAAAAPCPQPPRAAAEARPRSGGGLRVRVPLRIVVGAQYRDSALSTYVKVAALAMRPDGCTAKVAVIAEYLGLSKSEVERGLRDLTTPDDVDGLVEVVTTRRTLPGGRGQSAHRVVRQAALDEHFVWIPVRAADALSPRLLRLYTLIAYAGARTVPLAVGDLGAMLYHHTGQKAGQHLGERQAARLLEELAVTGWITVHRRAGQQGRHFYEVHRHPLQAVQLEAVAPDIHDGSGPDDRDGSLASREDRRTDRPVTKTGVGGGIRRRRDTGSKAARPVENLAPATFRRAGQDEKRSNNSGATDRGYTGPGLQLSPRVWQVLEPVRHELPGIRPYVLRRIAHEIGRQLSAGVGSERLTARLEARWASTEAPRRGDVGRWVLGSGLVRRGCGLTACESGTTWHTGEPCPICHDNTMHRLQEVTRVQQQRPVPEDQPVQPLRAAAAGQVPMVPWPPPAHAHDDQEQRPGLTREQLRELRAAATPESVREAIGQYGRAEALYLYGHALVLPHLANHEGNPV